MAYSKSPFTVGCRIFNELSDNLGAQAIPRQPRRNLVTPMFDETDLGSLHISKNLKLKIGTKTQQQDIKKIESVNMSAQ